MSTDLQALDTAANGTVPLEMFHQQDRHPVYGYKFTESADYLKSIGALDDKTGQKPFVLIPNYVLGPSNCIASSEFLSVCCINTCETLADEIWKKVEAPTVDPDVLTSARADLSTPLARRPRDGAAHFAAELRTIANKRHLRVELASPEFRNWLHYAFPSTW